MNQLKIWIGDRLPDIRNLNLLNLRPYLNRGALLIEDGYTSYGEERISERFNLSGGTILVYNEVEGLTFDQYKVAGTENSESIDGKYLAAGVGFVGGEIARVRYTYPDTRKSFCSRILSSSGVYMITYGIKTPDKTKALFEILNDLLTEKLPEGYQDLLIHPGSALVGSDTNLSTITMPVVNVNAPRIATQRQQNSGPSVSDAVVGLAGVAAGVAVEAMVGDAVVGVATNLLGGVFGE